MLRRRFRLPHRPRQHLGRGHRHAVRVRLLGITNTVGTIPGIVGVALTGWLVETTGSYDSVFMMVACVNLVGVVVWLLFAKGEKLVD